MKGTKKHPDSSGADSSPETLRAFSRLSMPAPPSLSKSILSASNRLLSALMSSLLVLRAPGHKGVVPAANKGSLPSCFHPSPGGSARSRRRTGYDAAQSDSACAARGLCATGSTFDTLWNATIPCLYDMRSDASCSTGIVCQSSFLFLATSLSAEATLFSAPIEPPCIVWPA